VRSAQVRVNYKLQSIQPMIGEAASRAPSPVVTCNQIQNAKGVIKNYITLLSPLDCDLVVGLFTTSVGYTRFFLFFGNRRRHSPLETIFSSRWP
jgi:hypothetical protein